MNEMNKNIDTDSDLTLNYEFTNSVNISNLA